MSSEIPVYKPGKLSNFFYYFFEVANILILVIFITAISFALFLYGGSFFDNTIQLPQIFPSADDKTSFGFHLPYLVMIPFLLLFLFILKRAVRDLFGKKRSLVMTVLEKGIDRSGNRQGSREYFIRGEEEAFYVTHKTYVTLQKGQRIKIIYTPAQKNVRMIQLLS